ncbi:MAG: hypothetical protein QNJ54_33610 [Prochloraceae cyanobacterium]|nr:hypothetical protein [Prochloraceae cyanobacterium]
MTRILYWNIQQFGLNKIQGNNRRNRAGRVINPPPKAARRLNYILSTFNAHPPDIFVIVEVSTGQNREGMLITNSGGQQGVIHLLNEIKTITNNNNWMIVPPLISGNGTKEGIAVFYDSTNLIFTGPYVWPRLAPNTPPGLGWPASVPDQGPAMPPNGHWVNPANGNFLRAGHIPAAPPGAIRSSHINPATNNFVAAGAAGAQPNRGNYPAPWTNPVGFAIPGNSPYNPGVPRNQVAGQFEFFDAFGNQIDFPHPYNRSPFLTTFFDLSVVPNRTIKLLSFHSAPLQPTAAQGTARIARIREMNQIGPNEVGVIVGDFNTNIFDVIHEPIAYNPLIGLLPAGAAYTRHINPVNRNHPTDFYVMTHLKSINYANPWFTNRYPGYDYMGGAPVWGGDYDSIDNIFTRYGAPNLAPPNHNITIINRVTGSPYNAVLPPAPAPPPIGNYNYPSIMQNAGALPLPPNQPLQTNPPTVLPPGANTAGGVVPGAIGRRQIFIAHRNYGHIRDTSDHLPLIIDV